MGGRVSFPSVAIRFPSGAALFPHCLVYVFPSNRLRRVNVSLFRSGDRAAGWRLLPHGRFCARGGGAGEGVPRLGRGVSIQLAGGRGESAAAAATACYPKL